MRDGLVGVVVLGGSALVFGCAGWLIEAAPAHSNLGWTTPTMLGMTIGVAGASLGVGLGGAWLAYRAKLPIAASLLSILGAVGVVLAWKTVDAANVVFDLSPSVHHEVEFIKFVVSRGKTSTCYSYVTSWSEPNEEVALSLAISAPHRQRGRRLRVTVNRGALGRAYATDLQPMGDAPP